MSEGEGLRSLPLAVGRRAFLALSHAAGNVWVA
jgi:hypothetical protein